ncbi:MAG: hypothetical protein M3Y71_09105 [Actinomycetota bacterium]|nr:hypothetical protein [Actinomycetota bacterium]
MSQQTGAAPAVVAPRTSVAPPTPAPHGAAPLPAPAGAVRRRSWGQLVSALQGTPGRLRVVAAVTAVVVAVFGLVAANTLWSSSGALERADLNLTQLVRVQGIQSDLLQADASATNAFLVVGLEPPAQRAAYDGAISRVTATIAEAASAQPADAAALGALNGEVEQYTAQVEQARALNRQGLTVGATYLRNASDTLRAQGMQLIDALRAANQTRLDTEIGASSSGLMLTLAGALALVVLVLALVELARRTHRYVNVPLAVGTGLVVVTLVGATVGIASVRSAATDARDGSVAATTSLSQVRAAAFDAKANESLTIILQGPAGDPYEALWSSDSGKVVGLLRQLSVPSAATGLSTAWDTYVTRHQAIRTTSGRGDYEAARTAAAKTDPASANGAFTLFTTTVSQRLQQQQDTAGAALTAPQTRTTLLGWLVLALTLAAAGLALRGVGQRLEEYR